MQCVSSYLHFAISGPSTSLKPESADLYPKKKEALIYVVVVRFQIKHHAIDKFRTAILENAATSRHNEPGCHPFEVCATPDRRDEIYLDDVYSTRTAFEAQLASPRFTAVDALVAPMIVARDVRTYIRVHP